MIQKKKLRLKLQKNGKGKEYTYSEKLIFEGQIINGKRNGKGKEYDFNGKLKFDCEYKDNLLNGKVKEYDDKGKLIFEGEYKDNKRWKGRADEEDFQGEYLNGIRWNGIGKEYDYIQGDLDPRITTEIVTFKGEYINGKKKGTGESYSYRTKTIHLVKFRGDHDFDPYDDGYIIPDMNNDYNDDSSN